MVGNGGIEMRGEGIYFWRENLEGASVCKFRGHWTLGWIQSPLKQSIHFFIRVLKTEQSLSVCRVLMVACRGLAEQGGTNLTENSLFPPCYACAFNPFVV